MKISAPSHLSRPAKRWFLTLQREYGVTDAAGLAVLVVASEAFDRARGARELIAKDGAVVRDRFRQYVPHPAVRIEMAARAQVLQAIKQLGFDLEPTKAIGRPGLPSGWSGR
jgi:phage terminase small subunit